MPYKDPEKNRQWMREYRRRQRLGKRQSVDLGDFPEVKDATDIKPVLVGLTRKIWEADIDLILKARTIGYLANVMLKAIEVGDFESRLSKLEEIVDKGVDLYAR